MNYNTLPWPPTFGDDKISGHLNPDPQSVESNSLSKGPEDRRLASKEDIQYCCEEAKSNECISNNFQASSLPSSSKFEKNTTYLYCGYCKTKLGKSYLEGQMLKCRGCQTTVYCGREHLTSDWDNHKKQCKSGSGLKRDRLQDSKPSSPISTEDKESETVLREQKKFIDHNLNVGFTKSLSDFTNLLALEGKEYNITDIHIRRCKAIAESVMNNLKTYGWATVDSFLGENHCLRTNNEVDGLYKRGLFNAGQLMDKQEKTVSHDIRSDQIYWYNSSDPQTQDLVQTRLLVSMIDSIVSHFGNKIEPYNISGRSRAMIAVYPGHGTKYVKHVDNPTNDGRCITAIYYCNQNWIMKLHGGALRLYPETSKTPIDIDPQADKLVVFWSSAQVPHEVMPVYRERFAITIWYFDKAEKEAAQNNKQLGDSGSSNDRKRGTSDDEDSPLSKILKNKMAKNQSHSF